MRRADTAGGGTNATSKSSNASARQTSSNSKKSGKKKTGRPRGKRSTGRYPFLAAVNEFLGLMAHGAIAESTYKDLKRKLKLIAKDVQYLYDLERISTANPKKMTAEDVLQIVGCWRDGETREGDLTEIYIRRLLDKLEKILVYCDNNAVAKFKLKYPSLFPSASTTLLPSLNSHEVEAILAAAATVDIDDWQRMIAYGLVITSICASCRPLELRALKVYDVHLDQQIIHIERVKGLGDYGMPRDTTIIPDGIPFLHRFLRARDRWLQSMHIESDLMFPVTGYSNDPTHNGEGMSENRLIIYKNIVVRELGIQLNVQKCRRTYAQISLDRGVPDAYVAANMGHTEETLHKHYARHSQEQVITVTQTKLRQATVNMAPEVIIRSGNSPLIEKPKWDPGYA